MRNPGLAGPEIRVQRVEVLGFRGLGFQDVEVEPQVQLP